MDPNECLRRILAALESNDSAMLEEAMEDLGAWLRRGGFPPTCTTLGWYRDGRGVLRERLWIGAIAKWVIQSISPTSTANGFEMLECCPISGDTRRRWALLKAELPALA
jgi:hypothetical protein